MDSQKLSQEELKLCQQLSVDYQNLRVLPDGTIIGTYRLMYTYGLHVGLDTWGWEKRYCYPTESLAVAACEQLQSGDDEPLAGYLASRNGG